MNPLGYLRALFSLLPLFFESRFPSLSNRKAISGTVAAAAIVAIIGAGGFIIYLILSTPSTVYPP